MAKVLRECQQKRLGDWDTDCNIDMTVSASFHIYKLYPCTVHIGSFYRDPPNPQGDELIRRMRERHERNRR